MREKAPRRWTQERAQGCAKLHRNMVGSNTQVVYLTLSSKIINSTSAYTRGARKAHEKCISLKTYGCMSKSSAPKLK